MHFPCPRADKHMFYNEKRMIQKHPRPRKPHNGFDFIPHFLPVAMNLTRRAKSFFFHKRAPVDFPAGIGIQIAAVGAKAVFYAVFFAAVQPNHLTEDLFFMRCSGLQKVIHH